MIVSARRKTGAFDLEALEQATRAALQRAGARLLEELLGESDEEGEPPLCPCGNAMRCEGARPKRLVSLKEMSARVALLRMQRDGLLRLPAPLRTLARPRPISASPATDPPRLLPLPGSLDEVRPLRLDPLRPKDPRSRIWNEFVDRYHYLGHKNLPGAQLRYFVHARDGLPLALLAQLERCLPADWHSRYNLRPVLLET